MLIGFRVAPAVKHGMKVACPGHLALAVEASQITCFPSSAKEGAFHVFACR